MALIEWSDALSLGIGTIDEQHKQLIAIINELHDAMMARQSRAILGNTFQKLKAYTQYHFDEEERLFEQHGYPERERHSAEHATLKRKVLELEAAFAQSDSAISVELMDLLRDWLREHLIGSDKKYVPFLAARGVS